MNAAVSEAIMNEAIDEEDVIVQIISKVETLGTDQVFNTVRELLDDVDRHYFEIGGHLQRISDEGLWDSELYPAFRDAVESETGIHYRKAMYLINIYDNLTQAEIQWKQVSGIGWSKLKEISSIVTKENIDEWVAKIMGPPELTVLQIHELVKELKVGSLSSSDPIPEETPKVTQMSFKLHPDQKENIKLAIEKAKGEAETEYDAVALDAICMNYLSGGKATKPKALSEIFKGYQFEEVLDAFDVVWPDIDIKVKL